MIPDNLIFINVVPVDRYFLWQEEVLLTNFRKFNIKNIHILIWCPDNRKDELIPWYALQKKYPEASFFFYPDKGVDLALYIPQLRPHILKEHFRAFPELNNKVFFYHDSDILFNYLPNFEALVQGDVSWQSDTSSYLDYNYLKRKEEQGNIPEHEAIGKLAEIGKVSVDTIKSYSGNTGGAQYILKGIDASFWEDVERQVLEIRRAFYFPMEGSINKKFFTSENEGFQSWCADMWAVNFSLWNRNIKTSITPELNFSWATSTWEEYLKAPIFHNAGVLSSKTGLFSKNEWIQRSPLGLKLPNPPINSASRAYIDAINDVK